MTNKRADQDHADENPAQPVLPQALQPAAVVAPPSETIPGGRYINTDGHFVNANGEFITADGKAVDAPVKAKQ